MSGHENSTHCVNTRVEFAPLIRIDSNRKRVISSRILLSLHIHQLNTYYVIMYFGDSDSMRIYLDLNEELVEKVEAYAKTKPFNMSRSAAINEILDQCFASENRT